MRQFIVASVEWGGMLRVFLKSTGGNVTLLLAIASVIVLTAVGVATDYSEILTAQTKAQTAADSAALASVSAANSMGKEGAEKYFMSNLGVDGAEVEAFDLVVGTDGAATVTATIDFPPGILSFLGRKFESVTVTSQAVPETSKKIESVTFQITNAQGAFDKDIYLITKDATGNTIAETLVLQYNYTLSGGVGQKDMEPDLSDTKKVVVGNYATIAEKMVVYEDTSYVGLHIHPKTYYSDDVNAKNWVKTSGDCETGQTQNWEDGGDSNYLDFVFSLKCKMDSSTEGKVRISN
jgi:Putative Flp pilus-assembly TadE/G-like